MDQSSPFLLTLQAVTKTYPGVNALQGVDFDLKPGEIHCLVGENGAGKSTLIRMLTGAERPDSGTITVGDTTYAGLTPALGHALGIGVIYQESDLVLSMTVADNIFLGHETADRRALPRPARHAGRGRGTDRRAAPALSRPTPSSAISDRPSASSSRSPRRCRARSRSWCSTSRPRR